MASLIQTPGLDHSQKNSARRFSQTLSIDYAETIDQLRGRRFSQASAVETLSHFRGRRFSQTPSAEHSGSTSQLRSRRSSLNPPEPLVLVPLGRKNSEHNDTAVDDVELPALENHSTRLSSSSPLTTSRPSGLAVNVPVFQHHGVSEFSANIAEPPTQAASVIDVEVVESHSNFSGDNTKRRLISACVVYFLCGWGDGVTGTVLPYLEAEFHLNDITASLLFTGTTVGTFLGTIVVERVMNLFGLFDLSNPHRSIIPAFPLLYRFSFAKRPQNAFIGFSPSQSRYITMLVGCIVHSLFFVLMGSRKGFVGMFMAYVLASLARAFWMATINLYLASTHKSALVYAFGLWSFGGATAPIVCQSIIATGIPWPNFYFGSLVVSGVNLCLVAYAFRPTLREFSLEKKESLGARSQSSPAESVVKANEPVPAVLGDTRTDGGSNQSSSSRSVQVPESKETLRLALRMPIQWALSLFGWLYNGCESTFQGFIISYLLAARHADPKTAGYVTSGFWGGVTVGRFLWGSFVSTRLDFTQRKYLINACIVFALIMHILIWFVKSNIENAFSASVVGLVYGPIWPGILTMASEILRPDVRMVSMALVSAFGTLGTSLFPLATGAIADVKGVQYLPYMTVPQTAALLLVWTLLPSKIPFNGVQ